MQQSDQPLSVGAVASLFLYLLCSLSAALAEETLQPFTANYRAYYLGVEINAIRELKKRDDNTMALYFRTQSFFIDIDENSILTQRPQTPTVLTPLAYEYRRTGLASNRHIKLVFDWQAGQIVQPLTKSHTPIPANTPVFDQLSYQLQLQYDLINGANELDYRVVDDRRLKRYRFRIVGKEVLTTELGQLATIKVERIRNNSKRSTHLWFAKDWNYLLVQLEQREESKEYRIELRDATVNGADIHG